MYRKNKIGFTLSVLRSPKRPQLFVRSKTSRLVFSLAFLILSGCDKAPTMNGSDQVFDPNIELTALKDNKFTSMSWPAVDDIMLGLVTDPNSGPGCAVGVVRDHEIIYLKGYGYARIPSGNNAGEKWDLATMGAVGSVSKSFTAVAALQMMDQGLLNFTSSVGSVLPSSPDIGNVEMFDLLAHKSLVGGFTKDDAFSPNWASSEINECVDNDSDLNPTPECLVLAKDLAHPAQAFTFYEALEGTSGGIGGSGDLPLGIYSNVGYSVLGAVIDQIALQETSSDGYEAFLWDNVGQWSDNLLEGGHLLSLALTHSWRANDIPHRAVGYLQSGPEVLEAWEDTDGIEGWQGPSGGWALTIGDLARFMIALDKGSFFENNLFVTAMRTEATNLANFTDNYGLGLFVKNETVSPPEGGIGGGGAQETASSPDFWHGGTIGAHNAVWTWWDDYENTGKKIGVAMICNRSDVGAGMQKTNAALIAEIALVENPSLDKVIVLQSIKKSAVKDRVFILNPERSWQSKPRRAFIPFTVLKNTLLLRPSFNKGKLSFNLAEGRKTKEGIQVSNRTTRMLKTRSFANPRFEAHATSVALETPMGDVVISDLKVEGAFSEEGKTMSEVAISGIIDTRQVADLIASSSKAICRDISEVGDSCQPCSDGSLACIAVRYQGLEAFSGTQGLVQ